MKKKILFITEALWIGGIETALVNLLNRLDYDKYDVTCLILRNYTDMAEQITPKCRLLIADRERTVSCSQAYRYKKLYHLTEHTQNPSKLHRAFSWAVPMIKWVENRLYIRYIKQQMKHQQFDTCVIYSDRAGETAICAIQAKRYLLFYHHGAMRKVYHDEIAYKKSEKIITVSERTVDMLKEFRPRYANKVIAVHNLVDIEGIQKKCAAVTDDSFPMVGFHLVTCGRLSHAKGIDWAISACKTLLDKGYHDLHWWIVGGGPEEAAMKQLVHEMGIEDHFHLLGMQSNPYPYIADADLYVQPSRFENYSVVILEAMVLGKPILATVPAAEVQVKSGQNGLLCQPNPEDIAKGIEYLYNNPEERMRYSKYLQEHTLETENQEIVNKLYQLFDGN